MTHLRRGDDDLHYPDGSHRGCPTTDGRELERHERRSRAHIAEHRAASPTGHRYTVTELRDLPRLAQGQVDDLKIDTGTERVWLCRAGVEDGMPYDHQVTVERLTGPDHPTPGRWITVSTYPALEA